MTMQGPHSARGPGSPTRGFSMVEMLVTLALLSVLALFVVPLAELNMQRERERELRASLVEIRGALDAYRAAYRTGAFGAVDPSASGYPAQLGDLVKGEVDQRSGMRGQTLRFLRKLPRDPFADTSLSAADSWGLRSYQSEADNPRPGADVYDVYSTSARKALDGTLLKDW